MVRILKVNKGSGLLFIYFLTEIYKVCTYMPHSSFISAGFPMISCLVYLVARESFGFSFL